MTTELPVHTNKAVAIQKEKRKRVSKKSTEAIEAGDVQGVINSLSERQRLFVEEYLKDLNATQAVLRSGYNTKYPNRIAFQLMESPAVRIAIDAVRAERTKNTDVTKDYVLQKITKALRLAEESGNLTAMLRATELLGRHLSLFVDRTELSGPDGKELEIAHRKIKEEADSFVELIDRTARKLSVVE
jgi:phage terminase small subunit